jgi:hypothetical protein
MDNLQGLTVDLWDPYITDGNTIEGLSPSDFACGVYGTAAGAIQVCFGDSEYLKEHVVNGPSL